MSGNTNTQMQHIKIIIIVLKLFGLDVSTVKVKRKPFLYSLTNYVATIIFHIIGLERIFHFVTLTIRLPHLYKIFIPFTFNSVVILVLWYSLNAKKLKIAYLLNKIEYLRRFEKNSKANKTCFYLFAKILIIILCVLPLVYSFGEMYTMLYFPTIGFYMWILDKNAIKTKVALFIRAFCSSEFRGTFFGLVCIFYCCVCWKIRQFLLEYGKHFKNILKVNLHSNNLENIFSKYKGILDLVESVDDTFSHIVFLTTIINSVSVFSLMAICFQISSDGSPMPPFIILEISFILITSATYLTLTITAAAQIPIEITKNITALVKIYQKMKQNSFYCKLNHNQKLLKMIKKRPVIILSGCHIIYFSRTLILTIIGTLVTYGLLIINFK